MKSYKKIVLSSVVIGAAMLLTGCGGATPGVNALYNLAESAVDTTEVETKNIYRQDGYGHNGFGTGLCYIHKKITKKNVMKFKYKMNMGSYYSKSTAIKMAELDYKLVSLNNMNGLSVTCHKPYGLTGFVGNGLISWSYPLYVDKIVKARTVKWTDYNNRFYKDKPQAKKSYVCESMVTGDKLTYMFDTKDELETIRLKTLELDRRAILNRSPIYSDYSDIKCQIKDASTQKSNRQEEINEILRVSQVEKIDLQPIVRNVAHDYLKAKRTKKDKVDAAVKRKAEIAETIKRKTESEKKTKRIKEKKIKDQIINGQVVDL